MKATLFTVSVLLILVFAAKQSQAGAPTCAVSGGTPYCSYSGRVVRAYVNDSNTVLMYFDTPFDLSVPASVGYTGITTAGSAAFKLDTNPDFAKTAYATLLAAQARGAIVMVQMRGTIGGYAKIDRIWIYE